MFEGMFSWAFGGKTEGMGCREYRDRLAAGLTASGTPAPAVDAGLREHLGECAQCREAVETAVLASQLVRNAQPPVRTSEAFVTRVMAAVREQEFTPAAIWRPVELLASRFALVAAVVLLGLSMYLAEFAPSRETVAVAGQTEIGAGMPERPELPANEDEILMSLAEMDNGI